MNCVLKHLKRFVSAVAILAALILGLMCLAPLPPERHEEPCVEVSPGVWRKEDPATGELTKPCSPSQPLPVPVPPTPSPNAAGAFYLIYYRGALENAGNQVIQKYNSSGKKGS